jgi:DNA-binding transcriptional MerR regulator
MKTGAFGKQAVINLTGLTYRQIDYWARMGVVKPSIKAGEGQGNRREYSFKDLVALRVAKSLRDEGISLQKIKKSLAYMKRQYSEIKQPLAQWRFLTDGKTIFIVDRDQQKILDTLNKGQLVIYMALGEIIEELQGEIRKLAIPKSKKVTVEGQTLSVVLTQDLESGIYAARCEEIPAAATEGDTEQEALNNIEDLLEELAASRAYGKTNRRARYDE